MSLAQIFGTFVHTENQQENSSDESEEKVGPASSNGFFGSTLMDLEAVAQQMEDSEAGQKTGEAENEVGMADTNPGLDFSALAMQLLQQAQGLFGASNGTQQQREEPEQQKPSPVEPVQSMPFGAQPPNRTDGSSASTPPAASVSSPKRKSGGGHSGSRRSGSKSLLSAATAAALLAPSPLGQIPSIPGAIAVAVSPAAQLFREDDWSWHRNPAAAIRSGGLNKQTPVWKYFVYNKAENLSRCIVGNCTYQLKGPHTSTLACHLKKHVAEYAEFQRLKVEYTRERIASGHGQAGQDPFNGDSGCSTPTSQNNGFLGVGGQLNPCSGLQLSQNGSRSPSALPTQFAASDGERQRFQQQQQKGGGGGNCSASSAGSSSLSCASSPGPPPSLACWQPPNCQQTQYQTGMATQQQQAGGSIFAPSSGGANLPAPPMGGFHQFMMAATLAAAQQLQQQQQQQQITQKDTMVVAEQQNGLRQSGGSESHSIGSIKAGEQEQKQQQQPLQMTSPNGVVNGGCSSLLDILNLLSKRATHSQQAPLDQEREEDEPEEKPEESSASSRARSHELLEEQAENGAADQQTQTSAEQMMQRRRSRKRTSSDATGLERGEDAKTKRRETAGTRADRTAAATGGGGGGLATHSVEHLLGQRSGEGGSAEEIDGSSVNSIVESANDLEATTGDGQQAMDKLMDGLALSLGTGLPRAELARLFDNPFLGDCLAGLSLDRVDQVLEQHFQRLKRRIQEQLARAGKEGVVALMAELCCSSCWKVPAGIKKEEDNGGGVSGLCLTKGCDGSVHFWCSLSAIFCPSAAAGRSENRQKRILLLAVRQMRAAESMESQLEEILASVPFPAECQPTLLLLRPMQLLTGDHPLPGLRCLPALFPDCLDRAFRCALADDRSLLLMLTKFRRMLEKFCASQGCQGEWKELTGHCLTLSHTLQATANSSQHQMELLNVAALLLPRQEQLQDIATRHLLDGDKKSALLDEEEWLLLNELARLLGLFRAEMRNGEGPARIPLSQVGGCLANVQKTLQKDFHALGDFPRKLNAELEKRTSPWVKQADGPYSTEIGNTAAAPTFHDVPCTPVSLSKVFGRNGDGWEWAGEEERWLERSALLLFNNHLLRNPEEL